MPPPSHIIFLAPARRFPSQRHDCQGRRTSRTFAHPDRIRFDGHCLTIEGKDTFIYSGAFIIFVVPSRCGATASKKSTTPASTPSKATCRGTGTNARCPRPQDFSKVDLTDLDDWLKMAEEFGFYVIIRPARTFARNGTPAVIPNGSSRRSRRPVARQPLVAQR